MRLTLTLDFWFDGIDDCDYAEMAAALYDTLQTGAEANCCEIENAQITKAEKVNVN